jgi:AcrR family transcriptional regulator
MGGPEQSAVEQARRMGADDPGAVEGTGAAPGRGRWNRRVTDAARRGAARARLLEAAGRVVAARGPLATVAEIVELAGVSRNTFYEHFEDVAAISGELTSAAALAIASDLRDATWQMRTPVERLRALGMAWLTAVVRNAVAGAALFEPRSNAHSLLSSAVEVELRAALELARNSGTIALPIEPFRLGCVVGAFVTAARVVEPGADVRVMGETLADLTLRAFR